MGKRVYRDALAEYSYHPEQSTKTMFRDSQTGPLGGVSIPVEPGTPATNSVMNTGGKMEWGNIRGGFGLPETRAKNIDWHNASDLSGARNFEAVIDADGSGDYATIQEAIDAGATSIYVRKGTYTITEPIAPIAHNTTIIGEGWRETVIKAAFTGDAIIKYKAGIYYAVLENLELDGDNQVGSVGVEYNLNTLCTMKNCYVQQCADAGVKTVNFLQYSDITNCVFIWNGDYDIFTGANDAYGNLISDNYFGSATAGEISILLGTASAANKIVNNNFYYGGVGNIAIQVGSGAAENTIANNYFYGSGLGTFYAIEMNSAYHNVIEGNTIELVFGGGGCLDNHVIYLDDSGYNIISDNNINVSYTDDNDTHSGIILDGTSTYNAVNNNVVRSSNGAGQNLKYCIAEINGSANYNVFTGNVLSGAVTATLLVAGANSITGHNIV